MIAELEAYARGVGEAVFRDLWRVAPADPTVALPGWLEGRQGLPTASADPALMPRLPDLSRASALLPAALPEPGLRAS